MTSRATARVFFGAFPNPPWTCEFCGGEILFRGQKPEALNIHHRNGNDKDDRLENLAASHHACHISYHKRGKPGAIPSDKTRAKMSASQLSRRSKEVPSDRDGLRAAALVSASLLDRAVASDRMRDRMSDSEYRTKVNKARWPMKEKS